MPHDLTQSIVTGPLLSKLEPFSTEDGQSIGKGAETIASRFMKAGRGLLVEAPAGYGKSTLLTEIYSRLSARGHVTAWLTLDHDENDPRRLFRYLLSAIVHAGGTSDVAALLGELDTGPSVPVISLVHRFLRSLETAPVPVTIFLDDIHVLNTPDAIKLIRLVMERMPRGVQIVVAGRYRSEIGFAELQLLPGYELIGIEDLCLDEARVRSMAGTHGFPELSKSAVTSIVQRSEGWAAAVKLCLLAADTLEDLEGPVLDLGSKDIGLSDYLASAVLRKLPEDIQRFMIRTSALDVMTADLCRVVVPDTNAQEMLRTIVERQLFVVALDRGTLSYRYHSIFRDFLRNELERREADGLRQIRSEAAKWLRQQGHLDTAIGYALAAEEPELALGMLDTVAEYTVQYLGNHNTLLEWISRVGTIDPRQHPEVLIAAAWANAFSQNRTEAIGQLKSVLAITEPVDAFDPNRRIYLLQSIGMIECILLALKGDGTAASRQCTTWLEKWPAAGDFMTAAVGNALAYAQLSTFDLELGVAEARKAKAAFERCKAPYGIIWTTVAEALLLLEQGRLDQAHRLVSGVYERIAPEQRDRSHSASLMALLLANIHYMRDELELAKRFDAKADMAMLDIVSPAFASLGYRTRARLAVCAGDPDLAMSTLADGRAIARVSGVRQLGELLAFEDILLRLEQKDDERVNSFMDRYFSESKSKTQDIDDIKTLTDAVVLLSQDCPTKAIAKLNPLLQRLRKEDRVAQLPRVLFFKSVALWEGGIERDALRTLDEAVRLSCTHGSIRLILDLVPFGRNIMDVYAQRGFSRNTKWSPAAGAWAEKLSQALGSKEKTTSVIPDRADEDRVILSLRESQILRLVDKGLSNREIASNLFLSEDTVKWHLRNCFAKLNVRNRVSAVRAARSRDLLPL